MGKKNIVVVGGGITGLSIAYIASKANYNVVVLEGSGSFGGLLNTFPVGSNRLEHYYHHFFTHDAEILWLINELGLNHKLIYRVTKMGVYRNGITYDFNSLTDLMNFSPFSLRDKAVFVLSSLFLANADWTKYENTAALDWFYKWTGKNITDSLWKPLLKIKFGPYANQIPLSWMIGRLRQRMKSRKKGKEQLGYLDGSLQTLLDSLMDKLKASGVQLIKNAPIQRLIVEKGTVTGVMTPEGVFSGDCTVVTIPSIYIHNLIEEHDNCLADKLKQVQYFGAVCIILVLKEPLSSIYWLNIADEGFPFGGIIEHTNFMEPKDYSNKHIVYLSRYFSMDEPIATMDKEKIADLMVQSLRKICKDLSYDKIDNIHIFRTNTAATVCDLNFSRKVASCKTPIQNFYIANMMHIYPDERSVNNAIRVASEACRVMGIDSDFVPEGNSLSGKIGFEI